MSEMVIALALGFIGMHLIWFAFLNWQVVLLIVAVGLGAIVGVKLLIYFFDKKPTMN